MQTGRSYLGADTGLIVKNEFLSYSKMTPKKHVISYVSPAKSVYQEVVLTPPGNKKCWQVFFIEGETPADVFAQGFAVNGEILGLYMDAGSFGSMDVSKYYGRDGIFINYTDVISLRTTNHGNTDKEVLIAFYVREYDVS